MRWSTDITRGGGYLLAFAAVGLASVVFFPLRQYVSAPVVMLLFVPIIVTIARVSGTRASATAAVLAFLFLDLIYIPPYYRLTIESLPEWIGLIVFLAVALISGQQTGRLRDREQAAVRRQSELELLNRLSFRLASEESLQATTEYIAEQVAEVAAARRVALYASEPGTEPRLVACAGPGGPASEELRFVEWVLSSGKAIISAGLVGGSEAHAVGVAPTDAIAGVEADATYLPLATADGFEGVLVAAREESEFSAEDLRLLVSIGNLTAAAYERARLASDAAHTQALLEADRLKSTLVSSVSHELKTPLAAAIARVTGLVDEPEAPAQRVREELSIVAKDLGRLDESIGDLLDLSRLESDAWRPRLVAEDIGDVLGTALSRLPRSSTDRIQFDLHSDLPPVRADFAQLARAFVNLLENALFYSPADSTITVTGALDGDYVSIAIEDRGPGVPDAEKPRIFEKFFRGAASASAPGGTGLGLAIASEIARSHGGTLMVEDAVPFGARFVMSLPVAGDEE